MADTTITVEPPDDEEWRRLGEDVSRVMNRAMELTAIEVWGNLRTEAPVDHGRLAGSFELESLSQSSWRIISGVNYAMAVWEGTAPHRIEPVNARALRFEIDGQVVFAKYVDHPGTPGDDYPGRAIAAAESRADEFIQMAIDEIVRQ
jgi:hypothetical protein